MTPGLKQLSSYYALKPHSWLLNLDL